MKRIGIFLLILATTAPGASSQTDALQRVEEMAAAGRLSQARTALDRWLDENPPASSDAPPEFQARALLLRGRLSVDLTNARDAYRSLVLSYPSSGPAAEGLLRLGQGLLAEGDAARALTYLQRLDTNHPSSPYRMTGLLWLARVHGALRDWPAACETMTRAASGPVDLELSSLLRAEKDAACSHPSEMPPGPGIPSRAVQPVSPTAGSTARFTVQVAALRDRTNAEAIAGRIRRAGFDVRISLVHGSALYRVRVGRFTSSSSADATARRLRRLGFDAVIATNVEQEQSLVR